MRLALSFLLLGLSVTTHADTAQDAVKPAGAKAEQVVQGRLRIPPPSLGISAQKPDQMLAAQLPNLPAGMGFLVTEVEEGGPAARAGIQVHDVIWKLGDQLLVNQAQMAALLRLRQPGDKVEISGFRSGKSQRFMVQLGVPKLRLSGVLAQGEPAFKESEKGITRVVDSSEMFAKTTSNDGEAEIAKAGEGYQLSIKDSKQVQIFSATIPAGGSFEGVPTAWKIRVASLKRALDQSISGELPVVRPPRPRVVPPPMTAKEPLAP